MDIDCKTELIQKAKEYNIKISNEQAALFESYMKLLLEWNEKINLTSITEPAAVIEKHFLDSILFLNEMDIKHGAKLIDIGTGAGFPGIPLSIMRPDIDVLYLDSSHKRLKFIELCISALGLQGKVLHKRAEEAGRNSALRESFDLAVSRAVAPITILCEYCIPFIKMKGFFGAYKGPAVLEELKTAEKAFNLLGVEIVEVYKKNLSDGDERNLVLLQKTNFTPKEYPRHGNTIKKHPL